MFDQREKLALFIDGANLYATSKNLGFDIDYKKMLTWFQRQSYVLRAYYYTALIEDNEYSSIRPLIDWLDYNGYTMVTKPAKSYTDAQGRQRIKGNMDMELAIDMLDMAQHLDHVILFSGDGDFRSLVDAVQRRGLRVTVVSTIKSNPPMIADELRRQADNFVELNDIARDIARNFHEPQRSAAAPGAAPARPVRGPSADFDGDYDDDDYDDDAVVDDEDDDEMDPLDDLDAIDINDFKK